MHLRKENKVILMVINLPSRQIEGDSITKRKQKKLSLWPDLLVVDLGRTESVGILPQNIDVIVLAKPGSFLGPRIFRGIYIPVIPPVSKHRRY